MRPIYLIILTIILIASDKCLAQDGIVSKDEVLDEQVELFMNNSNCNETDLSELVRLIQAAGDLEQGLRVMNAATKRFPDSYYAHYMRGFYNKNLKRYEEALSDFTSAISIEPRYAGAYLDRGECLKALNRQEEAFYDFNKAITESTKLLNEGIEYSGIEFAKPFALVGLGKFKEVRAWIDNYAGDDYYDVACLYSKMKDANMTLKYLQKALENGYSNINFIRVDDCMSWLKNNDRFVSLLCDYQQ